jgi:hypothetical protein
MLMRVAAPRPPIIPGNPKDRTGAGGILRRAGAVIRARFDLVRRDVLATFDRVPVYALNAASVQYGVTPETLAAIAADLQASVDRWLGDDGQQDAPAFWWDGFVQEAAQLGATQALTNLSGLSPTYASSRTLLEVLIGTALVARIAAAKFKSREFWTGLANEQRAGVAQVIGRAVADGTAPADTRKAIAARLDVGESKALAYALSDVTDNVRMARVTESQQAEQLFGLRTALLWTSALIATTRSWHASRHGQVYTADEVTAFYDEAGNRYNCRCATTECLLDADGKPLVPEKMQAKMANERRRWQSWHKA